MTLWHLFLLAVLPVMVLAIYIYSKDQYEKEPIWLLLKTFGMGILAVPLVLGAHYLLQFLGINLEANVFTRAFISAGLIEEGAKFFLLYKLIWRSPYFNERFDGIVYAVFVSLGFACIENLLYIFKYVPADAAMQTGISRALLAIPAHFLFAVIMGYYFSLAHFSIGFRRTGYLILSLLMAVIAHGCYDWLLMFSEYISNFSGGMASITMTIFYIFDILLWKFALRRMRKHNEGSNFVPW